MRSVQVLLGGVLVTGLAITAFLIFWISGEARTKECSGPLLDAARTLSFFQDSISAMQRATFFKAVLNDRAVDICEGLTANVTRFHKQVCGQPFQKQLVERSLPNVVLLYTYGKKLRSALLRIILQIKLFVREPRHVIVFTGQATAHAVQQQARLLLGHNVSFVEAVPLPPGHPASKHNPKSNLYRYYVWHDFLASRVQQYGKVLITDVRDVWIQVPPFLSSNSSHTSSTHLIYLPQQGDPFRSIKTPGNIIFSLEGLQYSVANETVCRMLTAMHHLAGSIATIGSEPLKQSASGEARQRKKGCSYNCEWVKEVDAKLGTGFLSELQDLPISCSGVTVGSSRAMLKYLEVSLTAVHPFAALPESCFSTLLLSSLLCCTLGFLCCANRVPSVWTCSS
jgi:hypothetical protein